MKRHLVNILFAGLLICFSAGNAGASELSTIYLMGGMPELADIVADNYRDTHEKVLLYDDVTLFENVSFSRGDLLYLDAASPLSGNETRLIRKAFFERIPIVTDCTGITDTSEAMDITREIGGLGVSAPVVVILKGNGKTHYMEIDSDTSQATEAVSSPQASPADRFQSILDNAHDEFIEQMLQSLDKAFGESGRDALSAPKRGRRSGEPYVPAYTFTRTTSLVPVNCNVGSSYQGSLKNYCNGSIQLTYTIDLMRSIPGYADGSYTEDAKYVRISISNDAGGAGIKVSDSLTQEYSWFQSYVNYNETLGGFAETYRFKIYPNRPDAVTLISHSPRNENPQYEKRESTSTTLGFSLTGGGEIGKEGPKVTAEATASVSTTNTRMYLVKCKEYALQNHTAGDTAEFRWEHETKKRASYYVSNPGCHTLFTYWYNLFDLTRFSPMSYSNFVPGFHATYRIAPSETGSVVFTVQAQVGAGAAYARDIYAATAHCRSTDNETGYHYTYTTASKNISIDFSHPVFEREPHVVLRSMDENDSTLDIQYGSNAEGQPVITYPSNGGRNQIWGYDDQERYRSRVGADKCLNVEPDLSLTVRSCGDGNQQKWYWQGDKLYSRYRGSDPSINYVLQRNGYAVAAKIVPEGAASTGSNWKPYLTRVEY